MPRPREWGPLRGKSLAVAVLTVLLLANLGCGARPTLGPVHGPATASAGTSTAQPATASASAPGTATAAATASAAATAGATTAPPAPPPPPLPAEQPAPRPIAPVAVVIGNDPAARPQSGLDLADVVWEIPAEGFITRYFAIFASRGSGVIGPVRSSRIYFDQLAKAYGIPFAHAGGNVDALNWIGTWHLLNIDAIYGSGGFFWRWGGRTAPDNLYTSTALLNDVARADRFAAAHLRLPPTTAQAQAGSPAAAVTIDYMTNPSYTYRPGWRWSGSDWVRLINGTPSLVASGAALTAQTVVILTAVQVPDPDPHTPGAIKFLWSRGGTAWVLRNGTRVQGQWHLGPQGLPIVTTAKGAPIPVGRGLPLWFEVVPAAWQVTFTP